MNRPVNTKGNSPSPADKPEERAVPGTKILHRYTGEVIYTSAAVVTIAEAAMEAVASGANLYGADLYGANLYGAALYDADLHDANLRDADLYDANLRGADLYDANLRGANLYGADLRNAAIDRWSLTIVASHHVITATADSVSIGCHTFAIEKWLATYQEIGEANGYTPGEIAEYRDHLLHIQAVTKALADTAALQILDSPQASNPGAEGGQS